MFEQDLIAQLIENNIKANGGHYLPTRRMLLNVPKRSLTLRTALETSITDRAIYHALTSPLIPYFDPLIPWCVFNHRHGSAGTQYTFGRAVPAWRNFIGVVRAALLDAPVLLSTDLTNYFEHIDLTILHSSLVKLLPEVSATTIERTEIDKHIDALFQVLKYWCYQENCGLPQNRDASSFLANIYMLAVDRAMLASGCRYFRYMDDIKIVCADEFEARKRLKELSLELRELGLSINAGKTQICSVADSVGIDRLLDTGGKDLQHLDGIWGTRKVGLISKTFPMLRDFAIDLLRQGKVDTREFRWCIKRLEAVAQAPEFQPPPEYFAQITPLVIDALFSVPASTDQLAGYLAAVPTTDDQLAHIADYLCDSRKCIYNWQNYRLWQLMAFKGYRNEVLYARAIDISTLIPDSGTRSGATIYAGALGTKDSRLLIAKAFKDLHSFLGQRSGLLAVQELHYKPHIKRLVQPFLRADLKGVYAGLRRRGAYVVAPQRTSITWISDSERDYA
jgi:hypothetical protein